MLVLPIKIFVFLLLLNFVGCNQIEPRTEASYTRSYQIADITFIDSLPPVNDFLTFDSTTSYGIISSERYLRFATPYNYGFYPIYLIDTLQDDTINLSKTISDNPLDTIYDIDFSSQREVEQSLKIMVDTSIDATIQAFYFTWYYYPKEDSLMFAKAYPILIQNTGDKPILLDRGCCFRAFLEAKDAMGRWRRMEDVLKWTCRIDAGFGKGTMDVNILPVNGIMIAKMFQPNGDFETECRLRYQFYNTVEDYYLPTGLNTGRWQKRFNVIHKEVSPIYSNVFRSKIRKSQFRKLNDDWFLNSDFY